MELLLIKAKSGDTVAKEKVLEKFAPLIYQVGISYYILGYKDEDLRELTKTVIIKSIETFNLSKGITFETYVNKAVKKQLEREIEKATKIYYNLLLMKGVTPLNELI